jgi:hypothetical protein
MEEIRKGANRVGQQAEDLKSSLKDGVAKAKASMEGLKKAKKNLETGEAKAMGGDQGGAGGSGTPKGAQPIGGKSALNKIADGIKNGAAQGSIKKGVADMNSMLIKLLKLKFWRLPKFSMFTSPNPLSMVMGDMYAYILSFIREVIAIFVGGSA